MNVSLGATLEILEAVHADSGFQFLMTARLNQDALERFFGMMRQSCGANDHPDPLVFSQVFRLLCTYSLVKPPKGSNVSGPELLQTLMQTGDSLAAAKERDQWLKEIDALLESGNPAQGDSHNATQCSLNDTRATTRQSRPSHFHLTDHSYNVYSSSDEVQSYLAGYVLSEMERSLMCSNCLQSLKGGHNDCEPRDAVIESMNRGRLHFPSQKLFRLTKVLEVSDVDVVGKMGINLETLHNILDTVSEHRHLPMVGSEAYFQETTRKIIDFHLIMSGHFLSRWFNRSHNYNQEKSLMHRKQAKL